MLNDAFCFYVQSNLNFYFAYPAKEIIKELLIIEVIVISILMVL